MLKNVSGVLCYWLLCDQGCLSDHSKLSGLSTLLYLSSHEDKLGIELQCWSYLQYMWTWSVHWFLFHVCDLSWTTDNVWGPGMPMLQVVFEWICEKGCNYLCILLHSFIKQGRVSLAYPPYLLVLTWTKIQWTNQVFKYCDHTHSTCGPVLYIDSCSVHVAYLELLITYPVCQCFRYASVWMSVWMILRRRIGHLCILLHRFIKHQSSHASGPHRKMF